MADLTFTYNGVTIDNANLRSVDARATYDRARMTKKWNTIIFRVDGTIRPADPTSGTAPSDMITAQDDARTKLLQPRANLTVQIGGNDWFNIDGPDDFEGPKPLKAEVTDIIGAAFSIVSFEVEVNLTECDSITPGPVVAHLFSVEHSLDEQFLTRRTVRGTIEFRARPDVNPDAFRNLITPQLPEQFKRERVSFTMAEDGLSLDYEVVDVEHYIAPPRPAIEADGTFSHRLSDFATWHNQLSVTLRGPKDFDNARKVDIFVAAFKIAQARMDFSTELVMEATLQESLYDNQFRLDITTRVVLLSTGNSGAATPIQSFMFAPLPSDDNTVDLSPSGASALAIFKPQFLNPCATGSVQAKRFRQGRVSQRGGNETAGFTLTVKPSGSTLDDGSPEGRGDNYSDEQSGSGANGQAPYLHFEEQFAHHFDNGLSMLPSNLRREPAIIYQSHNPIGVKIQRGFAIRQGRQPDVPAPNHGPNGRVNRWSIMPHAPKQAENKAGLIYTTNWMYEILMPLGSNLQQRGEFTDVSLDGNLISTPEQPIVSPGAQSPDDPIPFREDEDYSISGSDR